MPAKYPITMAPKGSLLHNESAIFGSKNRPDMNAGGGPSGRKAIVAPRQRTGAGSGANGRNNLKAKPTGPTHATAGNPASRGGPNGEARGRGAGVASESRIPGHGGSPQHREREIPGDFHKRGGIGAHGQEFVPSGRKSDTSRNVTSGAGPQGAGNTGGKAYNLIAGRFKRAAMGARASSGESRGAYGGAPITANT
jgi:hypothetical protein